MMLEQKLHAFPSPIWRCRVPDDRITDLNSTLMSKIMSYKGKPGTKVSKNKWYTPTNLQKEPEFAELCKYILEASNAVLDDLHVENRNLKITGCWGNISSPGATHHRHSHPNNYLSGVYYLKSGEGSNKITFHDPRQQLGLIRPKVSQPTIDNAETADVVIREGDIVLFPHWLNHSVAENTSDSERISIAFNVMFEDYVENMSPPMW